MLEEKKIKIFFYCDQEYLNFKTENYFSVLKFQNILSKILLLFIYFFLVESRRLKKK